MNAVLADSSAASPPPLPAASRRSLRQALIPFAVFIGLAPVLAALVLWIAGTLLLWSDHWDWRTPVGTAAMVVGYSPLIFILGFAPAAACGATGAIECFGFGRRPSYVGALAVATTGAMIYIGRGETQLNAIVLIAMAHLIPAAVCTRLLRVIFR